MMSSAVTVSKHFRFEASHVLPRHSGKCRELHGHSWELEVSVTGFVNPDTGFVIDYADLKKIVDEAIVDKLDHHHLGPYGLIDGGIGCVYVPERSSAVCNRYIVPEILGEGFYPSSENLVLRFVEILQPLFALPGSGYQFFLSRVVLKETCTSEAVWQV